MYGSHTIHSLFGGPLYNGLVKYNPETDDQTDIMGDLATDWEISDDGLTYTFHINESARWMDGEGVSAEDVVFSLDSMVGTDAVRLRVSLIRLFYKESRAVDGRTVEVETKFPAAPFFAYLAAGYFKIWPKHQLETRTYEEMRLEEDSPHNLINRAVRGMYVDDRIHNFHPPISLNDQMKMEHLWCDPRC